ncbi:hypothetical protein VA596_32585 [Amycolatopsis sp., V23-08]|uniref:Integral membrane protein n=1 Tax=Amycolatopsis heterodermiae TaxID=3110235 RepID=A0ABU5RDH2_9PSEU|nr:hypothetical protein [Amycolatopsis sp., V23-08]MEA5364306.1 hypothetical protein [Amycolatopsis sp., V23-08]
MIEPLAFATTVVCLLSGLTALVTAALGRYRWPRWRPLAVLIECALLAQAIVSAVGDHPAEPGTHLAYLATSLVVLPAGTAWGARENTRSAGALFALLLLTLAVLVVRIRTTAR